MNGQFCTVALLATLSVLSFASTAKAGLTLNGESVDGSTVDRAQSSLQSDDASSPHLDGSNLNGTSLDGSTVDHTQLSFESDNASSLDLQQNGSPANQEIAN